MNKRKHYHVYLCHNDEHGYRLVQRLWQGEATLAKLLDDAKTFDFHEGEWLEFWNDGSLIRAVIGNANIGAR